MNDLENKNIIVTGASGGIGFSIIKKLIEVGANVLASGTKIEKLDELKKQFKKIKILQFDISQNAKIEDFIENATNELGGNLDCVVNNAGITKDNLAIRMNLDEWQKVIDINLTSTFLISKFAIKKMLKNKSGKIVNITSVVGHTGNLGQSNYAASKAGIEGFTRSLSRELGRSNINVNCVAPGYIETDMTSGMKGDKIDTIKRRSPLGLAHVEDVAGAVSYLLSKDPIVLPTISKALRGGTQYSLEKIIAPVLVGKLPIKTQLPDFDKWRMFSVNSDDPLKERLKKLDNVLSWFRSVGKNTGQQFTLSTRAAREIKGRSRTIEKYLESIEKKAYDLAKANKDLYNTKTTSPSSQKHYLDQVLSFLQGKTNLNQLPDTLQNSAKNLNAELLKIKKSFAGMLPESELKKYMLKNISTYMRKSFSIFTDPTYKPDKKIFDGAVDYMVNLVKNNRDLRRAAIEEPAFKSFKPDVRIRKSAEQLVKKILQDGKTNNGDPLEFLQRVSKKQLRLKDIIKTGDELPDAIKKLLGEENNLKAAVMTTTSHAITQATNKKLFDRVAALGIKEGWLFKDEARANARGILDAQKIDKLPGLGFLSSRLSKLHASNDIVQAFRGTPGKLDELIQSKIYRSLLQLKVATQFGKTVLSPSTQVRNVTSASLFPVANGHIGGRASVTEAFKMTLDDIFGAGKVLDEKKLIDTIEDKIRRGVLDENIVASELGAVLKDIKKGSVTTLDGLYNKLTNGKFMKGATRVYAGGDNLWKWFGDEYVQSQMKNTYKDLNAIKKWFPEVQGQEYIARDLFSNKLKTYDDAIKEAAAWYIRNTYPTYSKVPDVIKAIRKLPFGNFVSFPAEMMRTSFNIMNIGMKEIGSSNAALRQVGYRRMIGAYTVLGGASTAALNIASEVLGEELREWI